MERREIRGYLGKMDDQDFKVFSPNTTIDWEV